MRLLLAVVLLVTAALNVNLGAEPLPRATPESVGMCSQRLQRINAAASTQGQEGRRMRHDASSELHKLYPSSLIERTSLSRQTLGLCDSVSRLAKERD